MMQVQRKKDVVRRIIFSALLALGLLTTLIVTQLRSPPSELLNPLDIAQQQQLETTRAGTEPPTSSPWLPAYTAEEIAQRQKNWAQWRGPLGTGVAPLADPPIEWSEDKNIRWKVALPGKGHSTPVIWNDRIFLTTAIEYGEALPPDHSDAPGAHDNTPITHPYEFVVMAIDRRDGSTLWRKTVKKQLPDEGAHYTGSMASNSPVTDGDYVYASFGSHGLYCLDVVGNVVWSKNFGPMNIKHGHGECSSPVLYGDALFVNWDHEDQSFVVALDKYSGDILWKVDRNEPTSWSTPIVVQHEGRLQLIVPGTNRTRGYDAATGEVIWECGGLSPNIVASPVAGNGFVYVGSSYTSRAVLGIRLEGATGDITKTDRVAWRRVAGAPYIPSLLLYDDSLYSLNHYQGVLMRVHAQSGENRPGRLRLSQIQDVYASPAGAAGRVYITDLNGTTVVLSHDDDPQVLAVNQLDDQFSASPAIVGKELYLRGQYALYCNATP